MSAFAINLDARLSAPPSAAKEAWVEAGFPGDKAALESITAAATQQPFD